MGRVGILADPFNFFKYNTILQGTYIDFNLREIFFYDLILHGLPQESIWKS